MHQPSALLLCCCCCCCWLQLSIITTAVSWYAGHPDDDGQYFHYLTKWLSWLQNKSDMLQPSKLLLLSYFNCQNSPFCHIYSAGMQITLMATVSTSTILPSGRLH
jgi:hypothetical protein